MVTDVHVTSSPFQISFLSSTKLADQEGPLLQKYLIRKRKPLLLTQEVREFFNRTKLGFVATVCPDGTPNLSPKGTTIAWNEEHLAFADIYSPGTTRNLLRNPFIEINVIDVFCRKGYRFKGVAEVLQKGDVFEAIHRYYQNAGSPYTINNIVWIRVDQMRPLFSPAYEHLSEGEITKRWIEYWSSIYTLKSELQQ